MHRTRLCIAQYPRARVLRYQWRRAPQPWQTQRSATHARPCRQVRALALRGQHLARVRGQMAANLEQSARVVELGARRARIAGVYAASVQQGALLLPHCVVALAHALAAGTGRVRVAPFWRVELPHIRQQRQLLAL